MGVTLERALELYQRDCKTVCPSTLAHNVRVFAEFMTVVGPTRRVTDIDRSHATQFQAHLLAKQFRDKEGMAKSSVNTYVRSVSSVFRWLVNQDKLSRNPLDNTKHLKVERTEPELWTREEYQAILDAIAKLDRERRWVRDRTTPIRWTALIMTAGYGTCGPRISEIVNLRWGYDIDLEEAELHIQYREAKYGQWWERGTKGRKNRTMPIFDDLLNFFYRMREVCPWLMPFLPRQRYETLRYRKDINYATQRMPMNNLYPQWDEIKQVAGIEKDGAFHQGRRTILTELASKLEAPDLQRVAGHASLSTTLRHYVHLRQQEHLDRTRAALAKVNTV